MKSGARTEGFKDLSRTPLAVYPKRLGPATLWTTDTQKLLDGGNFLHRVHQHHILGKPQWSLGRRERLSDFNQGHCLRECDAFHHAREE